MLSIIAAMDRNHLIGNKNQLPWHLPADFAHFKSVTMGKPIVMGRKTFESIGRPLPGRTNIVLTRNHSVRYEGTICVSSIEEAIAEVADADELMIIGGSTLYEMLLPEVDRLYITFVDAEFEGDAWFPKIDKNVWTEKDSIVRKADEKNAYCCRFVTFEKNN